MNWHGIEIQVGECSRCHQTVGLRTNGLCHACAGDTRVAAYASTVEATTSRVKAPLENSALPQRNDAEAQQGSAAARGAGKNQEPPDWREPEDAYQGREKDMYGPFAEDMRRRGIFAIHSRTDEAATVRSGLPDFILMTATGCAAVEFKAASGSVKPKQKECIREMQALGIPVCVAWNLKASIEFVREALGC